MPKLSTVPCILTQDRARCYILKRGYYRFSQECAGCGEAHLSGYTLVYIDTRRNEVARAGVVCCKACAETAVARREG